jgi:hypothetical protein
MLAGLLRCESIGSLVRHSKDLGCEPDAGAVIKDSAGCRKVRWPRPGSSKRDGVRVIYFTRLAAGELCMLLVYPKSERDTIPGHILRMIRQEIEDGIDQAS